MAKSKVSTISTFMDKPKRKRKNIHSKTKSSRSKNAKNYVKISRGQG
jgi:ribosomal protein L23